VESERLQPTIQQPDQIAILAQSQAPAARVVSEEPVKTAVVEAVEYKAQ
jgi:hypothetical protein